MSKELVDFILSGEGAKAKDVVFEDLDQRALEAIDSLKMHVGKQMFQTIPVTLGESFKAAQAKIARGEHVSKKAAGAILANSTRHASAEAKERNPKLKRVPGA